MIPKTEVRFQHLIVKIIVVAIILMSAETEEWAWSEESYGGDVLSPVVWIHGSGNQGVYVGVASLPSFPIIHLGNLCFIPTTLAST